MRSLKAVSKGLLLAGGAAASMTLAGCGPDYAIFRVNVTSASPRNDIEVCRMTVTAETGEVVLKDYPLQSVWGADSDGNPTLKQGCEGGMTLFNVGTFSYSTSRSGGSLKFTVNAYNDEVLINDDTLIQTKTSDPQEVKAYPPEIRVELGMTRLRP
jgi:hypothetical protein